MDLSNLPGSFLVFDGPDGGGKTSVRRCVAEHLRHAGLDVVECRDPGGTRLGEGIRALLLDGDLSRVCLASETLLFMASRAQLVNETIRPALASGCVVVCDRFVSATCAYQVAAGFDLGDVLTLARLAVGRTWPDLTFILDVPVATGFARLNACPAGRGRTVEPKATLAPPQPDAMERRPRAFHHAVRRNYLSLPTSYPAPIEIVDATRPLADVVDDVLARLAARFSRAPAAAPEAR